MEKKKISLLLVGVLLVVCVCIGISYAVWSLNLKQEETNTIVTGCFNVTFSGINGINLQSAYPISDEEGASLTPYEFTITNTCEDVANYQINLEILNDSTLTELGIIKELLQEKESTGTPKLLTSNNVVDKTLDNASSSYKLETGLLYKNESKTFELRLWMDENTEAVDSVMNKTFNSKITVATSYMDIDTTNMMVAMDAGYSGYNYINYTYTQNGKYSNLKVIFENVMNPYENATEIIDFSINKDHSVLGYYVPTEQNDEYILHIQANGKIKANPNGSHYFHLKGSDIYGAVGIIEGIENVDISEVTNMSSMFVYYAGETLNLSDWDIKKVTDMSDMFLFASNLQTLNLTNWNTSSVTKWNSMFSGCEKLTSIIYGSNFVYKNNASVENMFNGCPANKPTDTSWEGVL